MVFLRLFLRVSLILFIVDWEPHFENPTYNEWLVGGLTDV